MSQQALVPIPSATLARGPFSHSRYVIKRPFWTLFGRTYSIYDPDGNQVLFVRHPMRWRDAVQVSTPTTPSGRCSCSSSRARRSRSSQTYDITSQDGEHLGLLPARAGFKSITRDAWDLLDSAEQPIGLLQEDGAALLRRFFPL